MSAPPAAADSGAGAGGDTAGAVVTRDLPAGVVAGSPARVVRTPGGGRP